MSFFKPYSACAAASSTMAKHTRSLDLMLKLFNWHTTNSFFKHYLRKVNYFDRPGVKPNKNKEDFCGKSLPNVPVAPVCTYASHSLKRALSRCRNNNTRYVTVIVLVVEYSLICDRCNDWTSWQATMTSLHCYRGANTGWVELRYSAAYTGWVELRYSGAYTGWVELRYSGAYTGWVEFRYSGTYTGWV